ncbi:hypothetical protein BSL78_19442 [Apostichopus japonicus]|uniref:Voltage-gated hydrogen channel 1 n=1 Tax=Stichopus japonicus TaxID=307972 RepID=A0A2G8K6S3_STIJA|nr:hypothetical protein BSL78_19442 [Apostichopus japonicus]
MDLDKVFDIAVVVTSIVLDVVVFAGNLGTEYKWTRALSYLIILRCWRLYGVYYAEYIKIHNDLRTDIEMAKYGRRQAETQADALQSERDAQLKEIFHLREFLRQHSLDPNFLVGDGMHSSSPVHDYHGYGRAVSIDRAETMREESRLYPAYSEESAISSIADDKHKQVTAAHNVAPPPHRESEEKESGRHSDEEEEERTEIRSERSDDNSEYESAQDDDNVSGDGRDDGDNKESDHNDDRNREEEKVQEKEAEERNEITQKSKHNFEEGMEVKVERDVKVQGSGYRDSLISEGGIDNPAFEGDDTLQDEDSPSSPPSHHHHHHEEHSQSYKESPSKESAQLEGRSRTESDLAYVTEDVVSTLK